MRASQSCDPNYHVAHMRQQALDPWGPCFRHPETASQSLAHVPSTSIKLCCFTGAVGWVYKRSHSSMRPSKASKPSKTLPESRLGRELAARAPDFVPRSLRRSLAHRPQSLTASRRMGMSSTRAKPVRVRLASAILTPSASFRMRVIKLQAVAYTSGVTAPDRTWGERPRVAHIH